MKKLRILLTLAFFLVINSSFSQTWNLSWEKQFKSKWKIYFTDIIEDINGGYTVLGSINSKSGNLMDFWLVRLNETGDTLWTHTFSAPFHQFPKRLIQAKGGGYLMTGTDWDKEKQFQLILIRADSNGKELWRKNFGDEFYYSGEDFVSLDDGSFVIVGTKSPEKDHENLWFLKINEQGDIVWEKMFGGENMACSESIKKLPDGGFVIAGQITKMGNRDPDAWILRTDKNGDTLWTNRISTPGVNVWPECICCSPDSFLMVVGWHGTSFNDLYSENPIFDFDLIIYKINQNGEVLWTKNIDSEGSEGGNNVTVRPDGTFLIAGTKETSFTGEIGPWILHIDSDGNILSEKLIDIHFNGDQAAKVINTSDGGFVVTGPGQISSEYFRSFGWIMKFEDFK